MTNSRDDPKGVNARHLIPFIGCLIPALISVAALTIAIVDWLYPFQAARPSPLNAPRPPESRITCNGGHVEYSAYRWRISGYTECAGSLQLNETLIGYSSSLSDVADQGECVVFAFAGPSLLPPVPLSAGEFSLHSGALRTEVVDALLQGARNDLRAAYPGCDQRGIFELRLPLELGIPGYLEKGHSFQASLPGSYSISIVDGAYSSFPDGYTQAKWRTRLNIYHNRPIEWGKRLRRESFDDSNLTYMEPVNPDATIGIEESPDHEAAIRAGLSAPPVRLRLRAGDVLILVPIDDEGWYLNPAPNAGAITVTISLSSP